MNKYSKSLMVSFLLSVVLLLPFTLLLVSCSTISSSKENSYINEMLPTNENSVDVITGKTCSVGSTLLAEYYTQDEQFDLANIAIEAKVENLISTSDPDECNTETYGLYSLSDIVFLKGEQQNEILLKLQGNPLDNIASSIDEDVNIGSSYLFFLKISGSYYITFNGYNSIFEL